MDGILGSPELQAGITETSEAPPTREAAPPWLLDSCVAFMGHDQWLKAWAGSHKPSSWAGILIKLGLLGSHFQSPASHSAFQAPPAACALECHMQGRPTQGCPARHCTWLLRARAQCQSTGWALNCDLNSSSEKTLHCLSHHPSASLDRCSSCCFDLLHSSLPFRMNWLG